ncbi:ferredoxin [Nocardia fusca]|uniref:ferredoxin n=1 Tax=Nocardia fusca TaxID=941183 RepID=UPI0037925ABD
MKIELDRARCSGHARCNAMAPDVFDLDDEGYCQLPSAVVPARLEDAARDGVEACPERALTLTED